MIDFVSVERIRADALFVPIQGDGNCLFRALSHYTWGDQQFHRSVRRDIAKYLLENEDEMKQLLQFPDEGDEAQWLADLVNIHKRPVRYSD